MQISVSRDPDPESGMMLLDVDDVAFMETHGKGKLCVHTPDTTYYMPGSLAYWHAGISSMGYAYMFVDRSYVVNLNKIVALDSTFKLAYFDIGKDSKFCTLTKDRFREIKKILEVGSRSVIIT